jgi:hypothetical protein
MSGDEALQQVVGPVLVPGAAHAKVVPPGLRSTSPSRKGSLVNRRVDKGRGDKERRPLDALHCDIYIVDIRDVAGGVSCSEIRQQADTGAILRLESGAMQTPGAPVVGIRRLHNHCYADFAHHAGRRPAGRAATLQTLVS